MKTQKEYETKEIELASFLKASDIQLNGIRKNGHNKVVFRFNNEGEEADRKAMEFYTGNDTVSASKLFASFKMIKNLIFANQRGSDA